MKTTCSQRKTSSAGRCSVSQPLQPFFPFHLRQERLMSISLTLCQQPRTATPRNAAAPARTARAASPPSSRPRTSSAAPTPTPGSAPSSSTQTTSTSSTSPSRARRAPATTAPSATPSAAAPALTSVCLPSSPARRFACSTTWPSCKGSLVGDLYVSCHRIHERVAGSNLGHGIMSFFSYVSHGWRSRRRAGYCGWIHHVCWELMGRFD